MLVIRAKGKARAGQVSGMREGRGACRGCSKQAAFFPEA